MHVAERITEWGRHLISFEFFTEETFHLWHPVLCIFVVFNLSLLTVLVYQHLCYGRRMGKNEICCCVYVLVTSYRAAFPRDVLYKTCYVEVDGIFFSPIADRTFAAIAELCFALQQVFWTREMADQLRVKLSVKGISNMAQVVFYVIFFAQCLCFCGVFTSYPLFHALENSLWGVCSFLIILDSCSFYYHLRPQLQRDTKFFLKSSILTCVIFIAFLLFHDIPIWLNMTRTQQHVTPPAVGFQNSLECRFTQEFSDWEHNIAWLCCYNSLALWGSMYIAFRQDIRAIARSVKMSTQQGIKAMKRIDSLESFEDFLLSNSNVKKFANKLRSSIHSPTIGDLHLD